MADLQRLPAQPRDLGGGFLVRRTLPAAARSAVGPFVFFDHFGPFDVAPGEAHDVRPHPHIGLATLTYLIDGAIAHRDSLGSVQRIEPGAINLMSAGRGIVHSERTPDDLRNVARRLHGLQSWLALPTADEDGAPAFSHTAAQALPRIEQGGAVVRVLAGEAFGARSPVPLHSPTLYLDIALAPGAALRLPDAARERAVVGLDAAFTLDGARCEAQQMVVLDAGSEPLLAADTTARLVVIGGEPLGHRYIWWNFVHSRKDRIADAARDWRDGRFAKVPGDEREFIPLPARAPWP